ncbi:MAG: SNF2 family helicase [Cytophagaceae bacterium]|nr:SNF2 family helicase [Cytophagaceae bacterium]
MNVSPQQPFRLVYSLLQHEYLGYLFEASVVQLNGRGQLTFQYQTVSSKNVQEFAAGLDEADFQLVRLIDALQQDVVVKKFSTRRLSPVDFFLKIYDPQKGDKALQETICLYLEAHKAQILPLLIGKPLFVMGNDGMPTNQPIEVLPQPARVVFHFMRNPDNTHYFPTIQYQGNRVEFQQRNAFILCDEPAWLFLDQKLYHFEKDVDGKKLRPFLNKKFIVIPKNIEEDYYRKFVLSVITQFDVYAKGFEIRQEAYAPVPLLNLSETTVKHKQTVIELAGPEAATEEPEPDDESRVTLNLAFQYGTHTFRFDSFSAVANVSLEKHGDDYIFHKIRRDLPRERENVQVLKALGLDLKNGRATLGKTSAFNWLQAHYLTLREAGFQISQNQTDEKRYFLGYSTIEVSIREGNDWFDVYATVRFGEFDIPFLKLRNLILARKREFTLPNGEVAIIPEMWFTQYSELLAFAEPDRQERLMLRKHHLALVQDLQREQLASTVLSRKLEGLRDFKEIENYTMPKGFRGTLRPYQKAGYDWLRFLNQYQFGGCLADDMGLGKTAQTLALLLSQKETLGSGVTMAPSHKSGISLFKLSTNEASLVVMPTSLLYNWQLEAEKFAPELNILVYTGTYRDKDTSQFDQYDIVLTSYGIVRIDVELLRAYRFNYVILDESQAIKNPTSHLTRAVMRLQAKHRLILSGTPLENSTLDLWSQMSFLNPGLLGTQTFFRNEFQIPIEKRGDEKKIQRLYSIIKPFMLRRHKAQVATELPPKVESLHYSRMSEEQEQAYEKAKSYYRNIILEHIQEAGMAKSQMVVLQGLTRLRQLANHPRLVDPDYEHGSGKLEDVLAKIGTAISENHKILIFSQFVKHLDLLRPHLAAAGLTYAYLDGNTHNRQEQVERFQEDESVRLFLISLKAGGLGLNLTAADYVFILDPWWNPAVEAQAIDRAHRIGQDKPVFTYKFITKGTVEEKILTLQRSKQRLANELITTEEGFVKALTKEDILALLE